MDFLQMGLFAIQGIVLVMIVYLKREGTLISNSLTDQNMTVISFCEATWQDVGDKIESVQHQVNRLQKELHTIQQQQISWVNPKKVLPPVGERVLILNRSNNIEQEGFLSYSQNSWEVFNRGAKGMTLTFEEVSQWKPLLNKKTAPK